MAGLPATPSLTAEFGRIDPGQISIARWLLTSTLQGLFVDYQASIEHHAGEQEKKLTLIDEVSIHEMNHLVQAQGPWEDGKPDFLVNDLPDAEDLPDLLYLSDGTIEQVSVQREATIEGIPDTSTPSVSLTTVASDGWSHLRLADPGRGEFKLLSVTRSDGLVIPVGTNVWATDRTFVGNGRKPRRESLIHLLDRGGPGRYTLSYGPRVPLESLPPSSRVAPLPADSFALIPIQWSGADNPGGSGIAGYDIFVAINGGPFATWLVRTPNLGAVYRGQLGDHYAFYSVATHNLGNRQAVAGTPDSETTVTRENHAPTLNFIADQAVEQGDVLVVEPVASDPDHDVLAWSFVGLPPAGAQINPLSGLITWVTGEGLAPSTLRLTVQVLDNGVPRLGTTRAFNVRIDDRNATPVLVPIPHRTVDEGRLLVFTASATDADLPPQRLTFRFEGLTPSGATLRSDTGEFSWRPNDAQGGTTNPIVIVATDDGTPPLSATQSFRVLVRDTRSDFALQLGTTSVLSGATGSVPITLKSQASLTNLSFLVESPGGRLGDFALDSLVSELGTAAISPAGDNRVKVQFGSPLGQILPGGVDLARLRFAVNKAFGSAVLSLRLIDVVGRGSGGEPLLNSVALGGKVFLIQAEPLVDALVTRDGRREVILYGLPGHSYGIQFRTNLFGNAGWLPLTNVTIDDQQLVRVAPAVASGPVFYRAVQQETDVPRLRLDGLGSGRWRPVIKGTPGQTYRLESQAGLTSGPWREEARLTLTNSIHAFDIVVGDSGTRFFRAVVE